MGRTSGVAPGPELTVSCPAPWPQLDPRIQAPTEIFASPLYFPSGVTAQVTCTPQGAVVACVEGAMVYVQTMRADVPEQTVIVTIEGMPAGERKGHHLS